MPKSKGLLSSPSTNSKRIKVDKTNENSQKNNKNSSIVLSDSENEDDHTIVITDKANSPLREDESSSDDDEVISDLKNKQPAWIDEGDVFTCQEVVDIQGKRVNFGEAAGNDYKKSLEEKFQSVMGAPKWAQRRTAESTKNDYLTTTGTLIEKSSALRKDIIEIQKLQDLNRDTHLEGHKITSVLFHPTSTVGLVAGLSGVVSLVQVDGKENTKLQTIQYRQFPIHCSSFLKNGEEFIVGSTYHNYFYSHDMISGHSSKISNFRITDITSTRNFKVSPDAKLIVIGGKFGNLHVISAVTKELICTLKMNGEVHAFDFIGSNMYSTGSEGEVYVWDMNARQCVHRAFDDGCLEGTALTASPNGNLIACGSNTGVINIYDVNALSSSRAPTPLKTILNMVTPINCLKFNSTSEILAMSSKEKDNAIKLFHCPSLSMFSNFPTFEAKFHRVHCIDFSPNSGFIAFGNNKKTAHLYRLKYYGNY